MLKQGSCCPWSAAKFPGESVREIAPTCNVSPSNLNTVRLNEAVEDLSKVEAELFDLRQQERSAKDVLARTNVVAPIDGIVMDLKVHTAGGVVKPGEP